MQEMERLFSFQKKSRKKETYLTFVRVCGCADPAVPPEELEEVRLLEGALARALRIRGALGGPKCTASADPEGRDGNQTTSTNHMIGSLAPKSTSKHSGNYRETQKPLVSRHRSGHTGGCAAAGGKAPARPGPAAQTRVRMAHSLRQVKHPPTASCLGCQRHAESASRPPEEKGTAVTSGQRSGRGCVTETEQTGVGGVAAGDTDSRATDDGYGAHVGKQYGFVVFEITQQPVCSWQADIRVPLCLENAERQTGQVSAFIISLSLVNVANVLMSEPIGHSVLP